MPVVDPLLKLPLTTPTDQAQVVDPGRRARLTLSLRAGVHVALDPHWERQPGVVAVEANLDVGQLERVEDQIHSSPGQSRVDLVGVAVHPDRPGPGDGPSFAPAE